MVAKVLQKNSDTQGLGRGVPNSNSLSSSAIVLVMDDRTGCGSHGFDENGEPIFDYTCDDCMLPEPHLDPPEL